MEIDSYSFNSGREILDDKGVLEQIRRMPAIWHEHSTQYGYPERSAALRELGGWETEEQIDLGPADRPHNERLTPFLDAYHPDHHVAVEHEKKEQMRARWHLMKTQAAHDQEGRHRRHRLDFPDRSRPVTPTDATGARRAVLPGALFHTSPGLRRRVLPQLRVTTAPDSSNSLD